MGADIHGFVELKNKNSKWYSSVAKVFIDRDYCLFGLMAGVRGNNPPVVPPRGIPIDLSGAAQDEYYYYVSEKDDPKIIEQWLSSGISTVYDEKYDIITHPDWHTPSWLSLSELKLVKGLLTIIQEYEHTTLNSIIAMMEVLSDQGDVRLVFWFDN
jgi:hypothetical protein